MIELFANSLISYLIDQFSHDGMTPEKFGVKLRLCNDSQNYIEFETAGCIYIWKLSVNLERNMFVFTEVITTSDYENIADKTTEHITIAEIVDYMTHEIEKNLIG